MSKKRGLDSCLEAFERLRQGKPNNPKHIGLAPDKITAGIVSFEAGLDRGYLKRSRANHAPLFSLIDAYVSESASKSISKKEAIKKEKTKTNKYKEYVEVTEKRLEESLGRELLLVAKIRELENELAKYKSNSTTQSNVTTFK